MTGDWRERLGRSVRGWLSRPSRGEIEALAREVAGPEPERAAEAAAALGALGPRAIPAVLPLLSHWDPAVRSLADGVIATIGPAARMAVPALLAQLRAGAPAATPEETAAACRALRRIGDPGAVPALGEVAAAGSGEAVLEAMAALGDLGPAARAAVPALGRRLADERGQIIVRYKIAAATALGRIGGEEAVAVLEELARGATLGEDRRLAIEALGRSGEDGVVALSEILAEEPDPRFRAAAAAALGETASPAAIPHLVRAMAEEESEEVRERARRARRAIEERLAAEPGNQG
jgi:HEAT repeat protein